VGLISLLNQQYPRVGPNLSWSCGTDATIVKFSHQAVSGEAIHGTRFNSAMAGRRATALSGNGSVGRKMETGEGYVYNVDLHFRHVLLSEARRFKTGVCYA
jgi:hypothetical protein